jgi:hypothetical protein
MIGIIGFLLTGIGFFLGFYDLYASINSGQLKLIALGELWYHIHAPSLNTAQAVIQRYLVPVIWDPVIVYILLAPGWSVFFVSGAGLSFLGWHLKKRDPTSAKKIPNRRKFGGPQ